jgi:DNA-binding protein HU-beta
MFKPELIQALALKTGLTKAESGKILDGLCEVIGDALAHGDTVQLIGFGTFDVTQTKARTICHPETGEAIRLPAGKRPKFTAGANLKAALNKAR